MKKVLPIIPVPEWMKKRMAAVHSASPAPLSEMLRQGRASEEQRKKNGQESARNSRQTVKKVIPVIQPPAWFKKHMATVRSQSHAPLSEVLQQAKASEEFRRKLYGNRHGTGGKA